MTGKPQFVSAIEFVDLRLGLDHVDQFAGIDLRVGGKDDTPAGGVGFDFFDAQRFGLLFQFGDAEQGFNLDPATGRSGLSFPFSVSARSSLVSALDMRL